MQGTADLHTLGGLCQDTRMGWCTWALKGETWRNAEEQAAGCALCVVITWRELCVFIGIVKTRSSGSGTSHC